MTLNPNPNSFSLSSLFLCESDEGIKVTKNFTCDICCMTEAKVKTYALSCGHRYCVDCYQHFATSKVTEESDLRIQCMSTKCKLRLDDTQVRKLVKEEVFERQGLLFLFPCSSLSFFADTPHLLPLPSP